MRDVIELCDALGFPIEGASSAALQRTLDKYRMDPIKKESILHILQQLLMKPMQLAQYFCTGKVEDMVAWRHFALSVPL
jgi:exoribonuclease R